MNIAFCVLSVNPLCPLCLNFFKQQSHKASRKNKKKSVQIFFISELIFFKHQEHKVKNTKLTKLLCPSLKTFTTLISISYILYKVFNGFSACSAAACVIIDHHRKQQQFILLRI